MTAAELARKFIEDKQKELDKYDAKNHVVANKENASTEEKEIVKNFYRALASRDLGEVGKVGDAIAKDYKQKGQTVGTIGSGVNGGILVPTSVANTIVAKMNYISPLRSIATVISDMPAQLQLPSENSMVQAYLVGEGNAPTSSTEVFDPNMLTPYKIGGLGSFTHEVIYDAATNPSIQAFVESRFAIALALFENGLFTNGSGSSQPYGFRSSAITPTSIAQSGDTLDYVDCTKLKYTLKTAYRPSAVFVTSSTGLLALENIRDNQGRPIFRQGLTEGTPDKLLGRPIYLVDEIPSNLGATSDTTELWYGAFENFFIGDREGIRVDYGTNASDFANDMISLRVLKRVASRPVISESFVKLTGVK